MHEQVLDFTPLLAMKWAEQLRNAESELERKTVMLEMWEHVYEGELHSEVAA